MRIFIRYRRTANATTVSGPLTRSCVTTSGEERVPRGAGSSSDCSDAVRRGSMWTPVVVALVVLELGGKGGNPKGGFRALSSSTQGSAMRESNARDDRHNQESLASQGLSVRAAKVIRNAVHLLKPNRRPGTPAAGFVFNWT